jgi:beta-aspartyl-peptidase (threonine type)
MIVVASKNGSIGIRQAMEVLKAGGSAIDAVEAGIHLVEENPDDHAVGYGGFPNILGEVELDASIMDGKELMAGAVGAVKGYLHPISIARKVMDQLPHVFLVGEGAERFAAEMGFQKVNLLSEYSATTWKNRLLEIIPEDVFRSLKNQAELREWVIKTMNPEKVLGTVNFIAQDSLGNICTGVSTSGWFAKYPGRLGDSPVIGAGNYADNRYGAAACTGMGEMAIRASTARSVVLYIKMGLSLEEAGRQAMQDLNDLGGHYLDDMNIIAVDSEGTSAGFSNVDRSSYVYMTDVMNDLVEVKRTHVPTRRVWGS